MKRDYLLEAMDYIAPALVEQAEAPAKRRLPYGLRTALIAVCVCLGLLGTAFAVETIAGFQALEIFQDRTYIIGPEGVTRSFDGYELRGGVEYYPSEELWEELWEAAAANPETSVSLGYRDRQRVKELIGLDVTGNPTLDALIQTGFDAWLSTSSEGPTVISFRYSFCGNQNSCCVYVRGEIYTELMGIPADELTVGYFTRGTRDIYEVYEAENGLSAVIGGYSELFSNQESYRCHGDFCLDGIRYQVEVECTGGSDQALELLKEVLDGFAV